MRKFTNLEWFNLLFIMVNFCAFSQQKREIKIKNYVVINYKPDGEHYFFENAKPTTLNYEEIVLIEKIIKPTININLKKHKYYRQYVAVNNSIGEKLVWVNFFTFDYLDLNWNKTIIRVADGGNTVFQLKVNLMKKKCFYYSQGKEG